MRCTSRGCCSPPHSLDGLERIWLDPGACKGSPRVFGNGGLYSFNGLFRNEKFGTYRRFATDRSRAVVLRLARRVVVITPAAPDAFIEHMQQVFPGVSVEQAQPGAWLGVWVGRQGDAVTRRPCRCSNCGPGSQVERNPQTSRVRARRRRSARTVVPPCCCLASSLSARGARNGVHLRPRRSPRPCRRGWWT